jgi:hypothetical protein
MANTYTSKNLYHCSVLYALGKKLVQIEPQGRTYWFWFEGNDCEAIITQLISRDLMINAQDFIDAIHTLKGHIFSEIDRNRNF